jgi:hypothetical protein
MARHALLIGVSEFADERLARLNAPSNDVIALRGILRDRSRGHFDSVELSLNDDFVAMRDHVSRFFHDRAPDDLLLLYYSGHGILGRGNRLFLATAGSNLDTPRDRSISAKEIREFIEDCRAGRQVVVLDCCHSGAFAEHAKAVVPAPAVTPETFSGGDAGLYVLTAADALQFAWDGAELRTGSEAATGFSRFTSWLVDGLQNGEAAPDEERITMDALYRYLFRRARSEGAAATPQRFVQGGVGDLVISANPLAGSSQIDPGIAVALAAEEFRTRLGAVAELALLMDEGNTIAARAARLFLQRHLQGERDYQVRRAITKALTEELQQTAEPAGQAEEEQRAKTVQQTVEEEHLVGAERPATEEKQQRTEALQQRYAEPARPAAEPLQKFSWDRSIRTQIRLSVIGVVPASLMLLLPPYEADAEFGRLTVALCAATTFLAVRSEWKWMAYLCAASSSTLAAIAMLLLVRAEGMDITLYSLSFVTFAIESAAVYLNIRSRRSPEWKQREELDNATSLSDPGGRVEVVLSLAGLAAASLNILTPPYTLDSVFSGLAIMPVAGATFFAIKSRQNSTAYVVAAVNPVLAVFAVYLFIVFAINAIFLFTLGYLFLALGFSMESAAAILSVRSRGLLSWREPTPKPGY